MEYLIGGLLAAATALFAGSLGFARDRSFFPTILIVIATYYVLFAAMGGSGPALWAESAIALGFAAVAVLGFRAGLGWVAAALAGHGVFDVFHHHLVDNPTVPAWWPGFCLSFDLVLGLALAIRLVSERRRRTCGLNQQKIP
ncbi:MAG: hypothetical protein FIA97_08755 [Methylococcaceae bacterium]|nr:hypothetical protein [Methylococcaceae bacterium]